MHKLVFFIILFLVQAFNYDGYSQKFSEIDYFSEIINQKSFLHNQSSKLSCSKKDSIESYSSLMRLYSSNADLFKILWKSSICLQEKFLDIKNNSYYIKRIQKDSFELFIRGVCLFEKGLFEQSENYFKQYLKNAQNNDKIIGNIWYAAALYSEKKFNEANQIWDRVNTSDFYILSELSFMQIRSNVSSNRIMNILKDNIPENKSQQIIRSLILNYYINQNFNGINQYLPYLTCKPDGIYKNQFTGFLDPSTFYTMYKSCRYLSFFYANCLNHLLKNDPSRQNVFHTKYFRGLYYFDSNKFNDCITNLEFDKFEDSSPYLAVAYYLNGNKDKALLLMNDLNGKGNFQVKSELFRLIREFKIPFNLELNPEDNYSSIKTFWNIAQGYEIVNDSSRTSKIYENGMRYINDHEINDYNSEFLLSYSVFIYKEQIYNKLNTAMGWLNHITFDNQLNDATKNSLKQVGTLASFIMDILLINNEGLN